MLHCCDHSVIKCATTNICHARTRGWIFQKKKTFHHQSPFISEKKKSMTHLIANIGAKDECLNLDWNQIFWHAFF